MPICSSCIIPPSGPPTSPSPPCLQTLEGHTDEVSSVALTPDGRRALSGSWDKTLRLWDLETGACLQTLEGHTGWVESVALTPDGRRALSGKLGTRHPAAVGPGDGRLPARPWRGTPVRSRASP